MKLLKKKPELSKKVQKEESAPAKKERKSKLPPDTYKDEITPLELVLDESRKFVLSVKRGGELGLPCVDVRQFQTTELYTGFTKKGINFPIEYLVDLIDLLQEVYDTCEKNGILAESDE